MSAEVSEERGVGRRALLTRGGVVAAGVAGVAAAGAALAGPASAAVGDPVELGDSNNAGTNVTATEITVSNDPTTPTPSLVLTNTGVNTSTGEVSPSLRLTPAGTSLTTTTTVPSANTVGGDLVATNDGLVWFTHAPPASTGVPPFPAVIHTDATDTQIAPLEAPVRVLDTRSAAGRANILDASGNLNSSGQLIGGKTIHIDLSSLVSFAEATVANLTVTKPVNGGFLTVWSGAGSRPTASAINFDANQTIANLNITANAEILGASNTIVTTDSIAIFASVTTHILLDVTAFFVGSFDQIAPANLPAAAKSKTSALRTRSALAKSHTPSWARS